jgi:hypothetical protein
VELADAGVAVLQHLHVQVRGDRLDVLGLEQAHEAVHLLAPGPEIVGGMAAEFREAGHGALERMRMHVRHARDHRARGARRARRRRAGVDAREDALLAPFEQHIASPSRGQQRVFGEEGRHRVL